MKLQVSKPSLIVSTFPGLLFHLDKSCLSSDQETASIVYKLEYSEAKNV